ncbi:CDP-glucose 4,6-dehydratase [Bdellovibrio sp. NC01]|uniref:CDP-glucose 4,6-dehydratase n=1 Tax=Bdellovibrio sp. NC01 TaxID=2220073 RepID=UPI00115B726B|nr:CDP-glucose 4,6-dehydratase [Bdellovibrio sp. NC01]QDK37502.1 CDP-glucose 4,6-dehydratase [Bdellovibrio sp. NC01]
MAQNFWFQKKVFITGHSGFLGSHLALHLQRCGAVVFGYSLSPTTTPNYFEVENVAQGMTSTFSDIRDSDALKFALQYSQTDIVFHLSGGGGLKDSWNKVSEVYSSQVLGTVNLLEALRETATVRAVVILSSDKVYRSSDTSMSFSENDPLGGNAPASAAKACCELIVESYLNGIFSPEKYNKHKVAIATARLGGIIGGGDFSAESLIHQLAQSCRAGVDLPLKNPDSIRPWLHVDDAVNGLALLGQSLLERGPKVVGAWNFGVNADGLASVAQAKSYFISEYSGVPAKPVENSGSPSFHSGLDCSKAQEFLGWRPQFNSEQSVRRTAQWFKRFDSKVN